jgi:hypothetical protein
MEHPVLLIEIPRLDRLDARTCLHLGTLPLEGFDGAIEHGLSIPRDLPLQPAEPPAISYERSHVPRIRPTDDLVLDRRGNLRYSWGPGCPC